MSFFQYGIFDLGRDRGTRIKQKFKFRIYFWKSQSLKIAKNKLIQPQSIHKSSQFKLVRLLNHYLQRSKFLENLITCNFSNKLLHKYLPWPVTRVFCTCLFQSTSFRSLFSGCFHFHSYSFHSKLLRQTFLFTFLIMVSSEKKIIDYTEYSITEHTL